MRLSRRKKFGFFLKEGSCSIDWFENRIFLLLAHSDCTKKTRNGCICVFSSPYPLRFILGTAKWKEEFGDDVPITAHPKIRSEEACYLSSSMAVELAKKHGTKLHILHISTGKETHLFSNELPLKDKKITAEACVHVRQKWFFRARVRSENDLRLKPQQFTIEKFIGRE